MMASSGAASAFAASAISSGVSSAARRRAEFPRRREPVADRRKIARAAALEHQPRQRARKIRRGRKLRPDICARPRRRATNSATASSRLPIAAGSVSGAASRWLKQPRARDRHGAVDRFAERAAPLARERAHQFEIGARRRIDGERGGGRLACWRRQRRAVPELRALHIGDAGRGRGQLEAREGAEGLGRGHREIGRKPPLRGRAVEHVARQRRHDGQRAQIGRNLGVRIERVGHDDLARLDARDLGGERKAVAFGHAKFAGRNVEIGERKQRRRVGRGGARAHDRRQIIVAPRIEQRVFGERAGGDQPDHVARDDALCAALLCLRRVFGLLAHRDAEARRDQLVQIFVRAHHRHAAHRDVRALVLAALGQHDAERAARDLGVLEEQLVEIAHPVEQQAIRMGRLDLLILAHHRGDAGGVAGAKRRAVPLQGNRVGRTGALRDGHPANASRYDGPVHAPARGAPTGTCAS